MKKTFLICKHCKNIVNVVQDSGVPMICCGQNMDDLVPNTTDAAVEKHVPVVEVAGNVVTVTVGSTLHPMTEEHLIKWIAVETNKSLLRTNLSHTDEPRATFTLAEGEELVRVYEYCNLHGLWANV